MSGKFCIATQPTAACGAGSPLTKRDKNDNPHLMAYDCVTGTFTGTSGWNCVFIVLLLLMTSSSHPCAAETPDLEKLRQKAEQGDATAQYNLGVMYDEGKGVPRDYAEAVTWWRKAAEQGFTPAQYNLGIAHFKGEGVPRDYTTAYMWISLAAAQGDDNMRKTLDGIEKSMTPEQVAEGQGLAREWTAAHSR